MSKHAAKVPSKPAPKGMSNMRLKVGQGFDSTAPDASGANPGQSEAAEFNSACTWFLL